MEMEINIKDRNYIALLSAQIADNEEKLQFQQDLEHICDKYDCTFMVRALGDIDG